METLDSPHFQIIFSNGDAKEFEQIVWVLWTLRHQNITDEQRERILVFWDRCITWSQSQTAVPRSLLSALSGLAAYIVAVDERARRLLLTVAPHVGIGHHAYEFFDELLRLAEQHSAVIADVLSATIGGHVPESDYEDRLRKLLNTLASKGKKNEVLRMLDRLLSLPGMHDFFNELTRSVTAE